MARRAGVRARLKRHAEAKTAEPARLRYRGGREPTPRECRYRACVWALKMDIVRVRNASPAAVCLPRTASARSRVAMTSPALQQLAGGGCCPLAAQRPQLQRSLARATPRGATPARPSPYCCSSAKSLRPVARESALFLCTLHTCAPVRRASDAGEARRHFSAQHFSANRRLFVIYYIHPPSTDPLKRQSARRLHARLVGLFAVPFVV